MAGWNLKKGIIKNHLLSEKSMWAVFQHFFSEQSKKQTTYKFGLIKAILDNLFNAVEEKDTYFIDYDTLFTKFAGNYWNLIVKYNLNQMRKSSLRKQSNIEQIFYSYVERNPLYSNLNFESLNSVDIVKISKAVQQDCKNNVIGALYADSDGTIYAFDLKGKGIYLSACFYTFMLCHKTALEQLNYYAWAKFLENINDDDVLLRLLDKLELATPKRKDLSIYRQILFTEFEQNNCFYCGRSLNNVTVAVDHFIPWSYIKEDKLWNFVLSCPTCNSSKNNNLASLEYLDKLAYRNQTCIRKDIHYQKFFSDYKESTLREIYAYAKLNGYNQGWRPKTSYQFSTDSIPLAAEEQKMYGK